MAEERVRKKKKWGVIALFIFVVVIIIAFAVWYFVIRKKDVVTHGDNEEYISTMRDKSDLEIEELFLKDFLADLESRGFEYKETDNKNSEQYGFNLVFNIVKGDKDYCLFDEYRKHDLTKSYCDLKNPMPVEDESIEE